MLCCDALMGVPTQGLCLCPEKSLEELSIRSDTDLKELQLYLLSNSLLT